MSKKLSALTVVTTLNEDDLVYVVDSTRTAGDRSIGITKSNLAAQVSTSVASTNPVENDYDDIAGLLALQASQTENFLQYVLDDGTGSEAYYEKLAASTAAIGDYRKLSDTETVVVTDSNSYRVFRIQAIQDEGTPLTTVGGGRISFEYSGANVTAILFNVRYSKTVLEFYNKDVNVRFYNRTTQIYQTESVASTAWTTVNTDFYRAEVTGTNIQIADLTVNDRVEFFIVEASATSSGGNLEYQTEITDTATVLSTQKGLNKVYPFNKATAQTATVNSGVYVVNDVVNIERRGAGSVKIIQGTNVRVRGVRDGNNEYFINDPYSLVSLLCHGNDGTNDVFTIIGRLTTGYSGAVTTSNYTPLSADAIAQDVVVTGTGFSDNMLVSLTGNATLNSITVTSATSCSLNITPSGTSGDLLTVNYDNGNVFIDTDSIELVTVLPTSFVITTDSVSAGWTPSIVTNSGSTLSWVVTGGTTGTYNTDNPTIDLSGNSGVATITVSSADDLVGLTVLRFLTHKITTLNIGGATSLLTLRFFDVDLDSIANLDLLTSLTWFELRNNDGANFALDLTSCTPLDTLDVYSNTNITSVDISGLTSLTTADVYSNTGLTTVDVTGCTLLNTLFLQSCTSLATITGLATTSVLRVTSVQGAALTVSGVNQLIIDSDRNIVAGVRTLNYQLLQGSVVPTATETTANDVLDAYNNMVADGYTITGTTPA
jgi:hypothetical protein